MEGVGRVEMMSSSDRELKERLSTSECLYLSVCLLMGLMYIIIKHNKHYYSSLKIVKN